MINWDEYGFVISSRHRTKALQLLERPLSPSQLASKLKLSLAHGSKIMRELASKGLVECKNPKAKKGRVYKRTVSGDEVIKNIK